jgi:hypothetical protein
MWEPDGGAGGVVADLAFVWSVILGATFTASSVAKLLDFDGFRRTLIFTLRVEPTVGRWFASTVVGAELTVAAFGLAAVGPASVRVSFFMVTVALLAAFSAWVVHVLRKGLSVACQCFANRGRPVSRYVLLRNLALIACTGVVVTAAHGGGPVIGIGSRAVVAVTVFAGAAGLAAYRYVRPFLTTAAEAKERALDGRGMA